MNHCKICSELLDIERLNALLNVLCTPQEQLLCKSCAEKEVMPVRGIYSGEFGTSDLIFTNKISHQSGIFKPELERKLNYEDIKE